MDEKKKSFAAEYTIQFREKMGSENGMKRLEQ